MLCCADLVCNPVTPLQHSLLGRSAIPNVERVMLLSSSVSILLTVSRWTPERSARSRTVQSSDPRAALICALVRSTSPGRPESLEGRRFKSHRPPQFSGDCPGRVLWGEQEGSVRGVSQRFGSRLNSGLAQSASRSYSNNDLAGRSISGGSTHRVALTERTRSASTFLGLPLTRNSGKSSQRT
jgi:hypothetical protein